ncbi:hypothetical protein ACQ3I4_01770 [Zafaria sp. Z1313]|uniref:hypothetical protein n=1 Tax=unclassified Zafaria TaxID=2828765 RepID=UPI002E76CD55|nr:hypothetical protein [Zafaria sp. J156]MEE1620104.1 hypothetical protein [Zafaria sp. J156]
MPAPSGPCTGIEGLPPRGRVHAEGFVEHVRLQPAAQTPSFLASVVDAPAPPGGRRRPAPSLRLVWHGQRTVPGVVAGARLRFSGMVSAVDGVPTVFNPRYEILPAPESNEAPRHE